MFINLLLSEEEKEERRLSEAFDETIVCFRKRPRKVWRGEVLTFPRHQQAILISYLEQSGYVERWIGEDFEGWILPSK